MNFKKWVKSIQTAGYNGTRMVYFFPYRSIYFMKPWIKPNQAEQGEKLFLQGSTADLMPGAMTYTIGFEKTNINHHCTPCCFSIYSPRVLATNNQISGAATASLQIHKVLIAATHCNEALIFLRLCLQLVCLGLLEVVATQTDCQGPLYRICKKNDLSLVLLVIGAFQESCQEASYEFTDRNFVVKYSRQVLHFEF